MVDEVVIDAVEPARYTPFATLEEAVIAEPTSEAAWTVLGDAWAQADDPRGECILLSRGANLTDPAEFMRRKAALLPMARRRAGLFFGAFGDDAYRVSAKFVGGLVETVELAVELDAPGQPTSELLERLLAHPFSRFLSVLSFGAPTVAASLAAIATGNAPALRSLSVRQFEARSPVPVALGPASERLDHLRRLVLRLEHAPIDWTDTHLPALTQLELDEPGTVAACDAVLAWIASHPALEVVTIGAGLTGGAITTTIRQRLDDFATRVQHWPSSLREVHWNHRVARR